MKRLFFLFVGTSFLISCDLTVNKDITSQYLVDGIANGSLDTYLNDTQIFRYKGKPGIVTIPIGNADLSKYESCFVLHIETGTTQETTVSSAIIKLDGLEVLNSSDFSKNAGRQYTFEVCNLTSTSVLTVEIAGQPGSSLDIWIEGKLIGLKDIDGNLYNKVTIGTQIWMKENLKVTKYNDGSPITYLASNSEWSWWQVQPAYCWYNNESATLGNTYGALYNGFAVNTGKLCPTGWHVPGYDEWETLEDFLGGPIYSGGKLKEAGTTHWMSPNVEATNESGFTALPGGARFGATGVFQSIGTSGTWWTSTQQTSPDANWSRFMGNAVHNVSEVRSNRMDGLSVRCIKD